MPVPVPVPIAIPNTNTNPMIRYDILHAILLLILSLVLILVLWLLLLMLVLMYHTIPYHTVLCCAMLCYAMLSCAILHSDMQDAESPWQLQAPRQPCFWRGRGVVWCGMVSVWTFSSNPKLPKCKHMDFIASAEVKAVFHGVLAVVEGLF